MMTTNVLLDAALQYAREGIPVFPCREKKPLTSNGFYSATTDEDQIRAWWKINPDAQIAMPTGARSHILTVDSTLRRPRSSSKNWKSSMALFPQRVTSRQARGAGRFTFACRTGSLRRPERHCVASSASTFAATAVIQSCRLVFITRAANPTQSSSMSRWLKRPSGCSTCSIRKRLPIRMEIKRRPMTRYRSVGATQS